MKLNEEQVVSGKLAMTGEDLKISASAGAGKTTLLSAIGRNKHKRGERGCYITFSKDLVKESLDSGHFPSSVVIKTAHSFAFAVVGRHIGIKRCNARITPSLIAEKLELTGDKILTANQIAEIALSMVNEFIQSSHGEIGKHHLTIENRNTLALAEDEKRRFYTDYLLDSAKKLWELMSSYESDFPSTHDIYFKIWVMSKPQLNFNYIMIDEAQDLSNCMVGLLENQKAQIIMVYDTYQSIYAFRGAANAIDRYKTKNESVIRQSFRFGQPIADIANEILNSFYPVYYPGTKRSEILGFDKIKSEVVRKLNDDGNISAPAGSAIIARSNTALIKEAINNATNGNYIHLPKGVKSLVAQLKCANSLKSGMSSGYGDLSMFKTWEELVDFSETRMGAEFKPLVEVVEEGDIDNKIIALEKYGADSKKADFTYLTAHASKGSQFESVVLLPGFIDQERIKAIMFHEDVKKFEELPALKRIEISQEINLFYVAATRAKNYLNVSRHNDLRIIT